MVDLSCIIWLLCDVVIIVIIFCVVGVNVLVILFKVSCVCNLFW